MRWLKHNYRDIFLSLLLLSVSLFIAFKNYTPGTWLTGWDNLHPEFDLRLNIERSLSTAWQEYQGVGLLGGMAHAADLPRQLILWGLSVFIPLSFLRYVSTFSMLIAGPLGVYFLVSKLTNRAGGITAAFFYLFNLATVQTFYTPFDAFIGFYGSFPWLLYFASRYIEEGGKKRLLTYFVASLLATGAFYVQTMFIVYVIFLFVFAVEVMVRKKKDGILRSIKLAFVILFVNAFWLLPVTYFAITGSSIPGNSHINSIATPETQLMNVARSGFTDIATLKGYWLDYYDWKEGDYDYLYKDWISYVENPQVSKVALSLFFVSIAGLTLSLIGKKPFGFSFFILLGVSYFMLSGKNIPWIPLFSEIFRNVFTKWATAASLIYASGLGFFVYAISGILKGKLRTVLGLILATGVVLASYFTVYPVTQGKLIADSMRINIPSEYFQVFDYFKGQDSTKRIANFPLINFWGWKLNDWGYRGSGFTWYGIRQPILDSAFDVWSPNNEAFYNDIFLAVTREDPDHLKYVLNKYQVGYILFDGTIFDPGNPDSTSKIERQRMFLESVDTITKDREFGKITVYKVSDGDVNSFVSIPSIDYEWPYINLGQTGTVAVKETFSDSQGYSQAKNCNLKGRGSVVKSKIEGGNYYQADASGISCDYFFYSDLDFTKAYLMRIKGKNLSGRSLKFYLYSVDKQTVVLEELLPKGDFDESYYILPLSKSDSLGGGYTLNVETRSFGNIKSENIINSIEFYPVEFSYQAPSEIQNNLQVKNVKRYGTWAYKVEAEGAGLLELGQGYDKGWLAIQGNERLEHKKVNGWANGWTVTGQTFSQEAIYLVFWPQLLEWGGIVLGLITLVLIL